MRLTPINLTPKPIGSDQPVVILQTTGNKTIVIDGPFSEAKEVVGGYWLPKK